MTATANLERLGLPEGASDSDVEVAHAELVAYLELAPPVLQEWATDELASADKAYAELLAHAVEQPATANAVPPNGHATLRVRSRVAALDELSDAGDLLDGHVAPAPAQVKRTTPAKRKGQTAPAEPARTRNPLLKRVAIVAGALCVLAVIAFAGYQLGNPAVPALKGTPAPSAAANQLDPAQISALMQKITANPADTGALQQLADLYYGAGDYDSALLWLNKLLAVDPKNVSALLGAGAIGYNTTDYATAEKEWRSVLAIDDTNVEAHYDLGFMYFSMDPPKTDLARAEWNRVIELVPDSEIATTVKAHLQQLDAQPSGSPAAVASPLASPTTRATPAPSAAGN